MPSELLQILIIDDEEIFHQTVGDYLRDSGHTVTSVYDGREGLEQIREELFDVVLVDLRMPRVDGMKVLEEGPEISPQTAFIVVTGHGDMQTAIEALRRDAADFLRKPVELEELDAVLTKSLRINRLRQERRHLRETIGGIQRAARNRECAWDFVGNSSAAQAIRRQIAEAGAAQCDSVLITGETGTGKEVVARAIHLIASGESSPLIPVNCPAIPENLVESELFGHTKGAFTGADEDRAGAFELADQGSILLDEIGDLSHAAQVSLLRVLETRRLRRVGGRQEINVSLRVIATTNASLQEAVETGDFRRDLFYRLNLFHIHVPPLRERGEDILPLADFFRERIQQARGCECRGISPEAKQMLCEHDYPGNVRELRNIIEKACIVCRGRGDHGPIDVQHLESLASQKSRPRSSDGVSEKDTGRQDTENGERSRILRVLESCRWNRRAAARELDMAYSTLRYKIKQYRLDEE